MPYRWHCSSVIAILPFLFPFSWCSTIKNSREKCLGQVLKPGSLASCIDHYILQIKVTGQVKISCSVVIPCPLDSATFTTWNFTSIKKRETILEGWWTTNWLKAWRCGKETGIPLHYYFPWKDLKFYIKKERKKRINEHHRDRMLEQDSLPQVQTC